MSEKRVLFSGERESPSPIIISGVIYIIGGLFALILAVYFLDKREKMTHEIKEIKEYRHDIEETNRQLDEVQEQLDMMHEPLSKLNDISKKILSHMK